jgi:hypothetical protein
MRAVLVVGLFVLLCPVIARAQGAAPPSPATPRSAASPAANARGGGDITRDEYIERAKRNAEKRFEKLDANHDGVLTAEERRAGRAKRKRNSEPQ